MRRIAIVCEYATLNGGERSMLAALGQLPAEQFECVFLAPSTGRLADELHRLDYRHVPFDLVNRDEHRLARDQACDRLIDAVHRIEPDVVHANSLSMGRLTGAIAERIDIPCVSHLRDIVKLSRATIDDLNRNRLLIAVSQATREFHIRHGLDPERTHVIYNGVDCEQFRPRPRTGQLHDELRLPRSAFLIATIGQIGLRKGQDVLAQAATSLKGSLADAHYLLIGERNSRKQESIDFEAAIVERFREAGMESRLHRLGYRTDVARILNDIDLLVHPAQQEPLGRVLLEAGASGVAIVATNVGGTGEILEDGTAAQLIPANDAAALAAAISALYDSPEERARLSAAARQRICSAFSLDQAARALANVWEDAIAEK